VLKKVKTDDQEEFHDYKV